MRFLEPTRYMTEWEMIKEYKIMSGEVEYECGVHCVFQPRYWGSPHIITDTQSKTKGR